MTPNETPVNSEVMPSTVKPVLAWAESKKTPRWMLCLAAVVAGWMPEQVDDSVDEITEQQYDEALETAKTGYGELVKKYGKPWVKVLVHDYSLIAVVVRRLKSTEDSAVSNLISEASDAGDKQGAEMLLRQFDNVIVYPLPIHIAALRDVAPKALKFVLPRKWQASLGAEVEITSKKR